MLSARAICRRRSNKLARTSVPASIAGGATVKDIIFTINHVTQPAEFDKYADMRQRYFGPPSPKSMTVPVPQLASPDFLLQVEAFAKTR